MTEHAVYCPKCEAANSAEAPLCGQCGHMLRAPRENKYKPLSRPKPKPKPVQRVEVRPLARQQRRLKIKRKHAIVLGIVALPFIAIPLVLEDVPTLSDEDRENINAMERRGIDQWERYQIFRESAVAWVAAIVRCEGEVDREAFVEKKKSQYELHRTPISEHSIKMFELSAEIHESSCRLRYYNRFRQRLAKKSEITWSEFDSIVQEGIVLGWTEPSGEERIPIYVELVTDGVIDVAD